MPGNGFRHEHWSMSSWGQTLISSNVSVLDVSRHFETEDGEVIFVDNNGLQLYQDATHLSDNGAKRLKGALIEAFDRQ